MQCTAPASIASSCTSIHATLWPSTRDDDWGTVNTLGCSGKQHPQGCTVLPSGVLLSYTCLLWRELDHCLFQEIKHSIQRILWIIATRPAASKAACCWCSHNIATPACRSLFRGNNLASIVYRTQWNRVTYKATLKC